MSSPANSGAPEAGRKRSRPEEEDPNRARIKRKKLELQVEREETFVKILFFAAQAGYSEDILPGASVCRSAYWDERLWDRLVNIERGSDKRTALMAASHEGNARRVKWLLQRTSVDASAKTAKKGMQALHFACLGGFKKTTALLLNAKADVNAPRDEDKAQPLHLSALNGSLSVLALLLERGANINGKDVGAETALYKACKKGREATALKLIASGADTAVLADGGFSMMHATAMGGTPALVDALVAKGLSLGAVTTRGRETPLSLACTKANEAVALKLIELGAPLNHHQRNRKTALMLAVTKRLEKVVTKLVEAKAGLRLQDRDERTALHFCQFDGTDDAIAMALINAGSDVNSADWTDTTPLHLVCEQGNLPIFEAMVAAGADVNAADDDGSVPLRYGCMGQKVNIDLVRRLLELGAPVNSANKIGITALNQACFDGNEDVSLLLLNHGADPGRGTKAHRYPLHGAAENGSVELTVALIAKHAPLDVQMSNGKTPLFSAIEREKAEVAGVLLQAGCATNVRDKKGETALSLACKKRRFDLVRLLLDHGADPDLGGTGLTSPLYNLGPEDTQLAALLVARGADCNVRTSTGQSPFHRAAACGYRRLVEHMVMNVNPSFPRAPDVGSVDSSGNTALMLAVTHGHPEVVSSLLEMDPQGKALNRADYHGRTPLLTAAILGREAMALRLLDAGAIVSTADLNGTTPLHAAVRRGLLQLVRRLIERGAVASVKETRAPCHNALHVAAEAGSLEILRAVLSMPITRAASIGERDQAEMSALDIACFRGWNEGVDALLKAGVDVESKQPLTWQTALHVACEKGFPEIVRKLLQAGANPNAKDSHGDTPFKLVHEPLASRLKEIAVEVLRS
jgi:ankyrin repeat protein